MTFQAEVQNEKSYQQFLISNLLGWILSENEEIKIELFAPPADEILGIMTHEIVVNGKILQFGGFCVDIENILTDQNVVGFRHKKIGSCGEFITIIEVQEELQLVGVLDLKVFEMLEIEESSQITWALKNEKLFAAVQERLRLTFVNYRCDYRCAIYSDNLI